MYLFSFPANLWIELCLLSSAVELSSTNNDTLSVFKSFDCNILSIFSEFQCCFITALKEWTITLPSGWWLRNLVTFWYLHVFKASVTAEKIMSLSARSQFKMTTISAKSLNFVDNTGYSSPVKVYHFNNGQIFKHKITAKWSLWMSIDDILVHCSSFFWLFFFFFTVLVII